MVLPAAPLERAAKKVEDVLAVAAQGGHHGHHALDETAAPLRTGAVADFAKLHGQAQRALAVTACAPLVPALARGLTLLVSTGCAIGEAVELVDTNGNETLRMLARRLDCVSLEDLNGEPQEALNSAILVPVDGTRFHEAPDGRTYRELPCGPDTNSLFERIRASAEQPSALLAEAWDGKLLIREQFSYHPSVGIRLFGRHVPVGELRTLVEEAPGGPRQPEVSYVGPPESPPIDPAAAL